MYDGYIVPVDRNGALLGREGVLVPQSNRSHSTFFDDVVGRIPLYYALEIGEFSSTFPNYRPFRRRNPEEFRAAGRFLPTLGGSGDPLSPGWTHPPYVLTGTQFITVRRAIDLVP